MDRRLINNGHLATVTRKFDEFSPISLMSNAYFFFLSFFAKSLLHVFFNRLLDFSALDSSRFSSQIKRMDGRSSMIDVSTKSSYIFDLLIIFLKYFRGRMRRWNFTYTHLHARTIYFQVLINSRNETTDTRGYELTRCYSSNMYVSYVRR